MTIEKIKEICEREWDKQGMCASCGWHDGISNYDLEDAEVNEEKQRIELCCHSKNDENCWAHRGVRIYYSEKDCT